MESIIVLVLKVKLLEGLDALLAGLACQIELNAMLELVVVDIEELVLLLRHFEGRDLGRTLNLVVVRGVLVLHFVIHDSVEFESECCLVTVNAFEG